MTVRGIRVAAYGQKFALLLLTNGGRFLPVVGELPWQVVLPKEETVTSCCCWSEYSGTATGFAATGQGLTLALGLVESRASEIPAQVRATVGSPERARGYPVIGCEMRLFAADSSTHVGAIGI